MAVAVVVVIVVVVQLALSELPYQRKEAQLTHPIC